MKRFHSDGIFPFSLFIPLPSPFGEGLGVRLFHFSLSSPRGGREGAFHSSFFVLHSSFLGSQIRLLEPAPVEDDALNHLSCVDAFELESVLFKGFVDRYT